MHALLVFFVIMQAYEYFHCSDELVMWFGMPKSRQGMELVLPSKHAVERLKNLRSSIPKDAGKYALKLLSIFFSDETLAESNCSPAEGRHLVDPDVLTGIHCK